MQMDRNTETHTLYLSFIGRRREEGEHRHRYLWKSLSEKKENFPNRDCKRGWSEGGRSWSRSHPCNKKLFVFPKKLHAKSSWEKFLNVIEKKDALTLTSLPPDDKEVKLKIYLQLISWSKGHLWLLSCFRGHLLLSEVMDEFLIAKIRALDLFSIVVVIFSHTHCKPTLFVFYLTSLTPFSIGVFSR